MKFSDMWARGAAVGAAFGLAVPFLLPFVGGGDQAPILALATVPIGLIAGAIIGAIVGAFRKSSGPK